MSPRTPRYGLAVRSGSAGPFRRATAVAGAPRRKRTEGRRPGTVGTRFLLTRYPAERCPLSRSAARRGTSSGRTDGENRQEAPRRHARRPARLPKRTQPQPAGKDAPARHSPRDRAAYADHGGLAYPNLVVIGGRSSARTGTSRREAPIGSCPSSYPIFGHRAP